MSAGPIALVWAQAQNGVIGSQGGLPWRLPEDLAHFKSITMGGTVVMGRKTWDSLPERFRPLAGRTNIVVTRSPEFEADGVHRAGSVPEALQLAAAASNAGAPVWVIGGAQLFAEVMPSARRLEVTEIDGGFEGDTFAPAIADGFALAGSDPEVGWHTSRAGLRYRFLSYERG